MLTRSRPIVLPSTIVLFFAVGCDAPTAVMENELTEELNRIALGYEATFVVLDGTEAAGKFSLNWNQSPVELRSVDATPSGVVEIVSTDNNGRVVLRGVEAGSATVTVVSVFDDETEREVNLQVEVAEAVGLWSAGDPYSLQGRQGDAVDRPSFALSTNCMHEDGSYYVDQGRESLGNFYVGLIDETGHVLAAQRYEPNDLLVVDPAGAITLETDNADDEGEPLFSSPGEVAFHLAPELQVGTLTNADGTQLLTVRIVKPGDYDDINVDHEDTVTVGDTVRVSHELTAAGGPVCIHYSFPPISYEVQTPGTCSLETGDGQVASGVVGPIEIRGSASGECLVQAIFSEGDGGAGITATVLINVVEPT